MKHGYNFIKSHIGQSGRFMEYFLPLVFPATSVYCTQ